jgi:hypothetical protein
MNCRETEIKMLEIFPFKKGDKLPPDFSAHLAECDQCNRFWMNLNKDLAKMNAGRIKNADPKRFEQIMEKYSDAKITTIKSQSETLIRLARPLLVAAASVAIGIWVGGRLLNLIPSTVTGDSNEITISEQYAQDIYLNDETFETLESYLAGK